ncbi:MAG: hypothetical protein HY759_01250, partial [Nitrospirae bacterium]|nr:hypothetical protein [Nitrospirota bacterium]
MNINLKETLIPLTVALSSAFALFVVRKITFVLLHRWAKKADTKIDEIIIKSLKLPSVLWCAAIGLYIGAGISDFPEKYTFYFIRIIHVIVILSVTIALSNLAGRIFKNYIQKSNLPLPTTGLAYGILKG